MALVANSLGSLYNGVSQQPPSMRQPNQVEEMYNVYPSLEYGCVRREPLQQPDGVVGGTPIMVTSYDNSYTKMIIDGNSVYQLNINNGTPEVVQLEPFYKLLRIGDGITITNAASRYLSEYNIDFKRTQYSTTTIKNTTLIANEAVIPKTVVQSTKVGNGYDQYALIWFKHADAALGIDYTVTVNGKDYKSDRRNRGTDNKNYDIPSNNINNYSYEIDYPPPLVPKIRPRFQQWSNDLNIPVGDDHQPVYLSSAGRTAGVPGFYNKRDWMSSSDISQANAYAAAVNAKNIGEKELLRARSRRNALSNQQDKLDDWLNQDITGPRTTDQAAKEIEWKLENDGYIVKREGSMMSIETKGRTVSVSDSFGNQAVSLHYKDIPNTEMLPAKVNNKWTWLKFRVKPETGSDEVAYWVRWSGTVWEEAQSDDAKGIDVKTMPVEMRVEFFDSGSISNITMDSREWMDRAVGDDNTNEGPGFLDERPIRDIFFYRNRLGFLSDSGIAMTSSGEHTNLWRTTAITTLDSDPIDFIISTNSSTALRHTIMNQDKIFIFADNVQFVMDGGPVLSPKSVKVNEVSHYIVDLDIEPIVTDNKIIMIGGTDKSTIVYEYVYNESYGIAEATPLTAHVPGYILKDAICLAASNEDDMIFLVASDHRERLQGYKGSAFGDVLSGGAYADTAYPEDAYPDRKIVYAYKFSESGNQRIQSAWFKWNYRGSVLQVTAARGIMYLDIDHEFGADQTSTVIGTGHWQMTGTWLHEDMNWNMTQDDYLNNVQLQRRFAKQALRPPFLEATTNDFTVSASILDDEETIITDYKDFGEYINRSFVDLGEFVFKDRASKRYTASKTMLKSLNLKTDPGSIHTVLIRDMHTAKEREVLPMQNKKFKGIGLAANYYIQNMQRVNVDKRDKPDGLTFDDISATKSVSIGGTVYGDRSEVSGNNSGAFDSSEIANFNADPITGTPNINGIPNLYGTDVPIMVGGASSSIRVVISSFYDNDRDYGFRIHDIIQEARVNQRFKLS